MLRLRADPRETGLCIVTFHYTLPYERTYTFSVTVLVGEGEVHLQDSSTCVASGSLTGNHHLLDGSTYPTLSL